MAKTISNSPVVAVSAVPMPLTGTEPPPMEPTIDYTELYIEAFLTPKITALAALEDEPRVKT